MHFTHLTSSSNLIQNQDLKRKERHPSDPDWPVQDSTHSVLVAARHSRGRCTGYGSGGTRAIDSTVHRHARQVSTRQASRSRNPARWETQSVYTRRSVPAWPVATLVLWPGYLRSIPTTSYTQLPPRTIPFLSSTPRCYPCPFCSVRVSEREREREREREIHRCHSNIWFTVPPDRMPVVPPFIANPLFSSRILAENPVTSASRSFCSCEDKVHFSCVEGLDTWSGMNVD